MTRNEIVAHNAGVLAVVALARASADALRRKLRKRPTRYSFAVEALDGIAEIGAELVLPLPPKAPEPATAVLPKPVSPGGAVVGEVA